LNKRFDVATDLVKCSDLLEMADVLLHCTYVAVLNTTDLIYGIETPLLTLSLELG